MAKRRAIMPPRDTKLPEQRPRSKESVAEGVAEATRETEEMTNLVHMFGLDFTPDSRARFETLRRRFPGLAKEIKERSQLKSK